MNGEEFISNISRWTKSSLVAAHWLGVNVYGESPLRIAAINYFIKHEIKIKDDNNSTKSLSHPC